MTSMIRTAAAAVFAFSLITFAPLTGSLASSDRILGQWTNGWWYPARIAAVNGNTYHLQFEDGDRRAVGRGGVGVFDWRGGTRVQCKPRGQNAYHDAMVEMVHGPTMMVSYNNGYREKTYVKHCRAQSATAFRTAAPAYVVTPQQRPQRQARASSGYRQGQPVMAQWSNGWWYPARISGWNAEVYRIRYEDGTTAYQKPHTLTGRLWHVGSRVQCKWQGGKKYYDGVIAAMNGTAIRVNYDDGDREDTTVALCRSGKPVQTVRRPAAPPPPSASQSSGERAAEAVVDAIFGAIGEGLREGLKEDSNPPPAPRSGYGLPNAPGYGGSPLQESARDVPSDPEEFLRAINRNR